MVQRLKPVDVVTIGVGLTGSLAALELAKEGLKIVGLERGAARFTVPDFQSPAIHDELRFSIRKGMMQDNTKVAVTFRNNSNETALPIRRWESFLPGQGLGGSFVHWNGQSFRSDAHIDMLDPAEAANDIDAEPRGIDCFDTADRLLQHVGRQSLRW